MQETWLKPALVRSPGGGDGNPHQYSCLENFMDRGNLLAIVHGVVKSRTQLSIHTHVCVHTRNFTCYLLHLFYIKTSFVPSLLIDNNSSRNKNIAPTFQVIEVNRFMHIFLCFFHISLSKMPTTYQDVFLSFLHIYSFPFLEQS